MDYQQRAKEVVSLAVQGFTPEELYVVWFAKTLQNWKALVSTDSVDGIYWEVTHNGDKGETYVDTYMKINNSVVSD